jgi:hypothetical protein
LSTNIYLLPIKTAFLQPDFPSSLRSPNPILHKEWRLLCKE